MITGDLRYTIRKRKYISKCANEYTEVPGIHEEVLAVNFSTSIVYTGYVLILNKQK